MNKPAPQSDEDPVVAEVRERAMRISERFGHDPVRYFDHLIERQKESGHRYVNLHEIRREREAAMARPKT